MARLCVYLAEFMHLFEQRCKGGWHGGIFQSAREDSAGCRVRVVRVASNAQQKREDDAGSEGGSQAHEFCVGVAGVVRTSEGFDCVAATLTAMTAQTIGQREGVRGVHPIVAPS